MKVCWEFLFEVNGVRFERVHKFIATFSKEHTKIIGFPIEEFDAEIIIEPNKEDNDPVSTQRGSVKILLPGNKEETGKLVYLLTKNISQQINFSSKGEFKILYGLITGEHIPENEEEAISLNEHPYFAIANLIEIAPASTFDGGTLGNLSNNPLLEQFNSAKKAQNPIDKFNGLFKILEGFYGPTSSKVKTADSFKNSSELQKLALTHLLKIEVDKTVKFALKDFMKLVDDLVNTRNKCSHLKPQGYGIMHGNPLVRKKVEPLIKPLQILAYEAIRLRL